MVAPPADHDLADRSPGSADDNRRARRRYYESLEAMMPWGEFEVCPAHEYRFRALAERSRDLRTHHEERAREILDVLATAPELTVSDIAAATNVGASAIYRHFPGKGALLMAAKLAALVDSFVSIPIAIGSSSGCCCRR